MNPPEESLLYRINERITQCKLCPRLSNYIGQIGKSKVKRFINEQYWAKPLPGFGDIEAKLLIIGLAPAAHGGNRTGRMFTGDSSGDWLAKALFQTGFANIPTSQFRNDGLILKGAYIVAALRCAPPNNRPTPLEIANCSQYLQAELNVLHSTEVILTLGKIAFDAYCKASNLKGLSFGHGSSYRIKGDKILLASYHPSKQNTNTHKLTWQMWIDIFKTARSLISDR
ncbi:MAG: uracil-DNA glycosylase [Thermoproteota archaeon]|jgi:uracil-DNA glycosylase family 4|nr:uracil-DNA glycosylase [Thermoproteota archaeon]